MEILFEFFSTRIEYDRIKNIYGIALKRSHNISLGSPQLGECSDDRCRLTEFSLVIKTDQSIEN